MWRNDIKCKYMLMLPLKNLAHKGLRFMCNQLLSMDNELISFSRGYVDSPVSFRDINAFTEAFGHNILPWRTATKSLPHATHPLFQLGATLNHTLNGPFINSLYPSDSIWLPGSTLVKIMAWCLTAPSHYLNQWYDLSSTCLSHSPECNFTRFSDQ